MNKDRASYRLVAPFLLLLTNAVSSLAQEPSSQPTTFVPFPNVQMDDNLWRPRIRMLVRETLPHAFRNTQVAQQRLKLCAQWLESGGQTPPPEPHRFNTSDLYKVIEGAALMIQSEPNRDVEAILDRIIAVIARAQAKDGYLYVPHITGSINENQMGDRPYSYLLHSHELYNVGHLYEAAVAYARATGKTKLLNVAEKNARHVNRVIFLGDPNYNDGRPVMQAPGHQEIEIGLLKLYGFTKQRLYLDMAKKFLDIRGVTFRPNGQGIHSPTYAQQHLPVAEQRKATGHAVRATYQYAAMAEVDSLTGRSDYSPALDSIWHDIVDTKMHITGGLGAVQGIEGFGPSYVLPNREAYLETCAAVGNVFFNMRMFLKYNDAKFVDVAEIALLNNCLSGLGANGKTFFYPNPLEANWGHRPRSGWFGTACCPSNLARLIPQVPGYTYATDQQGVYCVLYAANQAELKIGEIAVRIKQETEYPWSGLVRLLVDPAQETEFTIRMRVPSWARSRFVPGQLYSYTSDSPTWRIAVNGFEVDTEFDRGFAVLRRVWKPGDRVELHLPMPIRVNRCLDKVAANRHRVCLTRGPIVLCAEGIDNKGAVQRYFIDDHQLEAIGENQIEIETIKNGPLTGLPKVTIPANQVNVKKQILEGSLRLIPYFAWSNRDRSSMQVWFGTRREQAQPDLVSPENFKFAAATASHTFSNDTVDAVRMRHTPEASNDTSIPRWTSWPQRGEPQWLQIGLANPEEIRSVGVYFYDDSGGVQVPKSWWLEIFQDDRWQKILIDKADHYSTLADRYNTVHPASKLIGDRLRVVMKPKHERTCVGILAIDIDSDPVASRNEN